jgi:type VI protein secretion system component Hcp
MWAKYQRNIWRIVLACMLTSMWFGFSPRPVLAATNKFLRVTGAQGGSQSRSREGWSDVVAYRQILTEPASKKPQCKVSITKMIDTASPFLWTMTATEGLIMQAILEVVEPVTDQVVFRSTMDNIKIHSVVNEEGGQTTITSNEGDQTTITSNMETLTLLPAMITFQVVEIDPFGRPGGTITARIACPQ